MVCLRKAPFVIPFDESHVPAQVLLEELSPSSIVLSIHMCKINIGDL